jgi:hypothetical protein
MRPNGRVAHESGVKVSASTAPRLSGRDTRWLTNDEKYVALRWRSNERPC